jgi:hypothetical protein
MDAVANFQGDFVKISHLDFDVEGSDISRLLKAGIIEQDPEDKASSEVHS